MEHAAVSNIDNIIICGEDETEDLILVVSEAYPKAVVSVQSIESIEIKDIDAFSTEASFLIPTAVAEEYFAELDRKLEGINLLPNYIKEEQKPFHIGWQGYLMMALIVLSATFFINKIFSNISASGEKDKEISRLMVIQAKNRQTVDKIKSYESKIQNVDQTKVVLNQLSSGTGILSIQMKKLADFANQKRNMWMNLLTMDEQKNVKLGGFTFSRIVVKELSDSYNGAILQNILYEPLRDTRAFKFLIDAGKLMGGNQNDKKNKSLILLIIIFVLITLAGGIYTLGFQQKDLNLRDSKLEQLRANYSSLEALRIQLKNAEVKVAVVDSLLFSGKFTIPQNLKQSNFFNFVDSYSGDYSIYTFTNTEFVSQGVENGFNYYIYKVTGNGSFESVYGLVYAIEHSKELKKIQSANVSGTTSVDSKGVPHYLVKFELQVKVYFLRVTGTQKSTIQKTT